MALLYWLEDLRKPVLDAVMQFFTYLARNWCSPSRHWSFSGA